MLTGVFDRGNGANNSLIVGNVLLTVKRDVEINLVAFESVSFIYPNLGAPPEK